MFGSEVIKGLVRIFGSSGRLELSGKQLADISALEKMCSLEGLDLSGNQITDLGPLVNLVESGCGNLEHELNLSDNPDLNEVEIEKLQIAFGKKEEESWEGSSVWFPFSHNAWPKINARRVNSRR